MMREFWAEDSCEECAIVFPGDDEPTRAPRPVRWVRPAARADEMLDLLYDARFDEAIGDARARHCLWLLRVSGAVFARAERAPLLLLRNCLLVADMLLRDAGAARGDPLVAALEAPRNELTPAAGMDPALYHEIVWSAASSAVRSALVAELESAAGRLRAPY